MTTGITLWVNVMNIGKEIKRVRRLKNIKQYQLMDLVGVSIKHISNMETGRVNVTVSMLERIAQATDTNLVILFQEK